jgi:FkbM family methyltransferase
MAGPVVGTPSPIFRLKNVLIAVLRLMRHGKHPKRNQIAAAYVRLNCRLAISKRGLRSFWLLGTEIHFDDAGEFRYLFSELFMKESYSCCHESPRTIVDCGSNIGMSILFFKSLWPNATITAIEASPTTFALLKRNVRDFHGVKVVNKAISDRHGIISLFSGRHSLIDSTNALRGGTRETAVDAAPLSDFITGPIDLLKMDIEGSEIAALAELEASGRIQMVREMIIEYHHHLPGQKDKLSVFLNRLERSGFDYVLDTSSPARVGDFQDILIRAIRND